MSAAKRLAAVWAEETSAINRKLAALSGATEIADCRAPDTTLDLDARPGPALRTTMTHARAAACDACPAKCRAELGARLSKWVPMTADCISAPSACPAGRVAAWRDEDPTVGDLTVTANALVSRKTDPALTNAATAETPVLLACFGCYAPCLLEVSAPVDVKDRCLLGTRKGAWFLAMPEGGAP